MTVKELKSLSVELAEHLTSNGFELFHTHIVDTRCTTTVHLTKAELSVNLFSKMMQLGYLEEETKEDFQAQRNIKV
jgi:hypothetical protein